MSGSRKTETKSEPSKLISPYLKDLFSQASTTFGGMDRTPFGGEYFADPTGGQQDALAELFARSAGIGGGYDAVRSLGLDTVGGKYLSPDSNPFLAEHIDAAIRPVEEKYKYSIMPGLEDWAIGGGAYGGARHGLNKEALAENFAREAGGVAGNIAFENYAQERGRQMEAPGLLGAADQLALAGPQAGLLAGGIEQGWDQNLLNEAIRAWQDSQTAPWAGFNQFAQILGLGQPYGTQTSTQTTGAAGNIFQGLLGAGGLGLQAMKLFNPAMGLMPNPYPGGFY